ncbi:MAG: GNAT family N-acetyltransferase [Calditrichaeota bacterium]|nr:MAG: GNAT family N-acetyltransferase [Calditrichota bacterium]
MGELNVIWHFCHFNQLTLKQLYDVLAERQRVFIVEQNCPFLDADGLDEHCWHLLGYRKSKEKQRLIAYSRIVPAGLAFKEAAIGRIITSHEVRGMGAGKALMVESIRLLEKMWGNVPIKLGAQRYLIDFYSNFGFQVIGEPYDEDGIPHVYMLRQASVKKQKSEP